MGLIFFCGCIVAAVAVFVEFSTKGPWGCFYKHWKNALNELARSPAANLISCFQHCAMNAPSQINEPFPEKIREDLYLFPPLVSRAAPSVVNFFNWSFRVDWTLQMATSMSRSKKEQLRKRLRNILRRHNDFWRLYSIKSWLVMELPNGKQMTYYSHPNAPLPPKRIW